MKEVLSQSEIDRLINNINQGEKLWGQVEVQSAAKKYNFRLPNKFTKDQLRTLHMIHDNFSRILSNFLSGYLRSSIHLKVVSVEQLTYEDFLVSIPSPTLLTIFKMSPLNGNALLEFNLNFVFPIIDLLFGGAGSRMNRIRELSEIELRVLRKLNERVLESLSYAWAGVIQIKPEIDSLETNPQFNQIIAPNEIVAIITFSAQIAGNHSTINLCLPFVTLGSVIANLTAQNWFSGQQDKEAANNKDAIIQNRIAQVPLDLYACCGECSLTVREFLQLRPGDVVILDKLVNENMELFVGKHHKFQVQPGVVNNKLAVQITARV
ncbi:MAG: flagellar motor switch protein FliM [Syntrophomonadaceae bacterium]|jgi:flagellar motor switch protein FliM